MHCTLRGFVQQLNRVARMDGPGLQDGSVESAQTPNRRRGVPGFHILIVDGFVYAWTINPQRFAGRAEFGDLDENVADAVSLADANASAVEAAGGNIFAERAVIQREALLLQLVDAFGSNQQDGFAWAAVNLRIIVPVACDAERSHHTIGYRPLGYSAWGDADL
jgi:hypothetical protein